MQPSELRVPGIATSFRIKFKPYSGTDFSRIAFLFCGQGQMSPGIMAEEVRTFPIFISHFKELDALAGAAGAGRPSDFILRPKEIPADKVATYSILCLYTLQVSMFETLAILGHLPKILSSHSFGEFALLTSAGVIKFADMVNFLLARQESLTSVKEPFTMVAVNDSSKMSQLSMDIEYYGANFNTQRQTTYVCKTKDVDKFRAILKDNRVASIKVDVDYPYHTPWLEPARQKLSAKIKDLKLQIHPPKMPFVSSVTGSLIYKDNFSTSEIEKILVDQLTTPVRFPEQLRAISAVGISHFYELAPIDVLTPFVEQVFQGDKAPFKVDSFRRKVKALAPRQSNNSKLKDSKILGIFNKALKSLSGYTLDDIRLEDRIREELGIDSIKKAEIVFQIVDSMSDFDTGVSAPVNLAELATFGDVIDYLESNMRARENMTATSIEKNLTFDLVKRDWQPRALTDFTSTQRFEVAHLDLQDVRSADGRIALPDKGDLVVMHWREDFKPSSMMIETKWWLSYFKAQKVQVPRWIFIHPETIASNSLNAMLMTWAQENQISYKTIRNPFQVKFDDETLVQESFDFHNAEVRYCEKGERWTRQFEKIAASAPRKFKKAIVFGGAGGVGSHCCLTFKKQPLDVLVIVGRNPLKSAIQTKLDSLKGCARQIEYLELDVTHSELTKAALKNLFEKHGEFDLIVHSVGVELSEQLANTTGTQIDRIVDSKLILAETLLEQAKAYPNLQVVLNTSIIAEFGNFGQGPYAFVNQYLNEMARTNPNIIALEWPAWENTGMAEHAMITKTLHLQGLPVMKPEKGRELFEVALTHRSGFMCVLCYDYIPDYMSSNHSRHEIKGLFRPASKNRQLYALSGLNQKHLPYLKHHIVKKVCPFPASGTISLMVFRAYQETGILGSVRDFHALNFVIVQPETSNFLLEATVRSPNEMYMQVRSSQLLAQGTVGLKDGPLQNLSTVALDANVQLDLDFDQGVSIYIGPDFRLEQGIFLNTESRRMFVRTDLAKTPQYSGAPIFDKLHKLLELCFNASCLQAVLQHRMMLVPKSVEEIHFHSQNFKGHKFFAVLDQVNVESENPLCDVTIVNQFGERAIEVKGLRSIVVSRTEAEAAKDIVSRPIDHAQL